MSRVPPQRRVPSGRSRVVLCDDPLAGSPRNGFPENPFGRSPRPLSKGFLKPFGCMGEGGRGCVMVRHAFGRAARLRGFAFAGDRRSANTDRCKTWRADVFWQTVRRSHSTVAARAPRRSMSSAAETASGPRDQSSKPRAGDRGCARPCAALLSGDPTESRAEQRARKRPRSAPPDQVTTARS
jgi:hypothetical protein